MPVFTPVMGRVGALAVRFFILFGVGGNINAASRGGVMQPFILKARERHGLIRRGEEFVVPATAQSAHHTDGGLKCAGLHLRLFNTGIKRVDLCN